MSMDVLFLTLIINTQSNLRGQREAPSAQEYEPRFCRFYHQLRICYLGIINS